MGINQKFSAAFSFYKKNKKEIRDVLTTITNRGDKFV